MKEFKNEPHGDTSHSHTYDFCLICEGIYRKFDTQNDVIPPCEKITLFDSSRNTPTLTNKIYQ